ncbi:LysR family transcriptional regulator [Anaeromyxobacter dehalogenans]|uniref:Transcriptional regulator, LysR family n=1 Tax=Anaeromyxobacter dehalogenans (strain 2CP-C) TaxID=290397 RepID=Q2IEG3_ANADE|nr:LysR family transcriptional regulator [Anaeromyxobacter dehalogenans]ABC82972.1 transcriptional regulator, LysR family [Anaeromyxobacter dehalogenans 2CP-C]
MRSDLAALEAFLAVADNRSFRAAGQVLGVTSSAVSQAVHKLEERLGVQLFARTTRSVALTEAGEHLRAGLRPAFAQMRETVDSLGELKGRPAGLLRLNVSSVAEAIFSEGVLAAFLARHPGIRLDVAVDDTGTDIVKEGFDAGIQLGEVIAQDMVAVNVTREERQIVVASPRYLAAHGVPRRPRDLHKHACIGWRVYSRPAPYRWEFTSNGREIEVAIEARVDTNEMAVMVRLALDGVGIAAGLERTWAPHLASGKLVSVLDEYCPPFSGFFLYYPRRTRVPAKLRALIDFLKERRN